METANNRRDSEGSERDATRIDARYIGVRAAKVHARRQSATSHALADLARDAETREIAREQNEQRREAQRENEKGLHRPRTDETYHIVLRSHRGGSTACLSGAGAVSLWPTMA